MIKEAIALLSKREDLDDSMVEQAEIVLPFQV